MMYAFRCVLLKSEMSGRMHILFYYANIFGRAATYHCVQRHRFCTFLISSIFTCIIVLVAVYILVCNISHLLYHYKVNVGSIPS